MIIGKNFFITEIPKTGTTFLRNYFKKQKGVSLTTHHDTVEHNLSQNVLNKKYKIGIVRSPYNWYLSLWRWSCLKKKKSPVYSDLISKRLKIRRLKFNQKIFQYILNQVKKNTNKIKNVFKDVSSKKNFNQFLSFLLDKKFKSQISSDFSFTRYNELGYMTYFFFYQNTLREDYNELFNSKKKFSIVIENLDKKIFSNYFFKTENLSNDLKKFLKKNKMKIKKFNKLDKNQTKKNSKDNVIKFFTKKNLKLIEKKEDYLFKKFKYIKISNKL